MFSKSMNGFVKKLFVAHLHSPALNYLDYFCASKFSSKKYTMVKIINRPVLFFLFGCLITLSSFAQQSIKNDVPKGWHLMSKETSGYYGISLDKAYEFL